jgi:hypothetical protein
MREESKDEESEERKQNKKKAWKKQNNNPLMPLKRKECKCGQKDHSPISSSRCLWKRLLKVEVAQKYTKRMSKNVVLQNCDENRLEPTTEPALEATEKGICKSGNCEEHVQLTSKYFGASSEISNVTSKHM